MESFKTVGVRLYYRFDIKYGPTKYTDLHRSERSDWVFNTRISFVSFRFETNHKLSTDKSSSFLKNSIVYFIRIHSIYSTEEFRSEFRSNEILTKGKFFIIVDINLTTVKREQLIFHDSCPSAILYAVCYARKKKRRIHLFEEDKKRSCGFTYIIYSVFIEYLTIFMRS